MGDVKNHYYQSQSEEKRPSEAQPTLVISTLRGPLRPVNTFLNNIEHGAIDFYKEQNTFVKSAVAIVLVILYIVYFIFAIDYDFDKARNLVYITAFALFCFIYWAVKKYLGHTIWDSVLKPIQTAVLSKWRFIKW